MKRAVVCLFVLFVAVSLYANPIQMGNFPVGKWLDPNFKAVWDFSSNNIRILSTDGKVLYDFSDKTILNYRAFLEGSQPCISFSCLEAGRTYRFIKPLSNTDLIMEIKRSDLPNYSVEMRKR